MSELQQRCQARLSEGVPLGRVAKEMDVQFGTLRRWARENQWVRLKRREDYSSTVRERTLALVDELGSIAAAHRLTGVARKTITRWRRRMSILSRDEQPKSWRCDCNPFGVTVLGNQCPKCLRIRTWQ